jgi:hypothetical protein
VSCCQSILGIRTSIWDEMRPVFVLALPFEGSSPPGRCSPVQPNSNKKIAHCIHFRQPSQIVVFVFMDHGWQAARCWGPAVDGLPPPSYRYCPKLNLSRVFRHVSLLEGNLGECSQSDEQNECSEADQGDWCCI